ncbi:hypothetical protein VTO73DRAFT_5967 [Trametes versicolor]
MFDGCSRRSSVSEERVECAMGSRRRGRRRMGGLPNRSFPTGSRRPSSYRLMLRLRMRCVIHSSGQEMLRIARVASQDHDPDSVHMLQPNNSP